MFNIKISSVGGQAVMEGVMMRDEKSYAMVVRNAQDKKLICDKKQLTVPKEKNKIFALPIIRGVYNFVQMLMLGMNTLTKSSKLCGIEEVEEEPGRFEKYISEKLGDKAENVIIGISVTLAIGFFVLLFVMLPSLLAGFFSGVSQSSLFLNAVEGIARLIIFFIYILAISKMKDINRVFMYHGAEHMTINCYENEKELTVENVREYSRFHPRCGTNYLFLVMIVSILLFSFLGFSFNPFIRLLVRIIMLPVVAGVAYEVLRACARNENTLTRIIRAPGLFMQKFTTKPPSDDMLEVAIAAFNVAMDQDIKELDEIYYEDIKDSLNKN